MVNQKTIAKSLRSYDLELQSFTPVRRGFLLETNRGRKFFKFFAGSLEDLEYVRGATEHLVERGFTFLSRFILTKYGEPYSFHGDSLGYLSEWIDGREIDLSITGYRRDAFKLLRVIHEKAEGYIKGKQPFSWLEKWRLDLQEALLLKDKLLASSYLNEFDQLFLAYNNGFIAQGRLALDLLGKTEYSNLLKDKREQGGFCHRAFYGQNLLRDEAGDYWVVDFDHCGPDLVAAELGKLLLHYLPTWNWSPEAVKSVIEEYRSVAGLPPEEEKILLVYLCFPHEFFGLCRTYKNNPREKGMMETASQLQFLLARKNSMFGLTENLLRNFE